MTDKPKWQRARCIADDERPFLVGRTFWVLANSPETRVSESVNGHIGKYEMYTMNILGFRGHSGLAPKECVELLPEFADDVPLIPWEEFINGR